MSFLLLLTKTILLLCLFVRIKGSIAVDFNEFKSMEDSLKCGLKIFSKYKEKYNLVAHGNSINLNFFDSIVTSNLRKKDNKTNKFIKYRIYFIVIANLDEFRIFLNRFSGKISWNPRAKFIIIFLGTNNETIDVIFQLSWDKYITNIAVIQNTYIFTYFPYDVGGNCGKNISKTMLGSCEILPEDIFVEKVPIISSNGCEAKSVVNIFVPGTISIKMEIEKSVESGFEVVLVANLIRRCNLTIRNELFEEPYFNIKFPNGSYGGPIKYLFDKRSDLALGHLWPSEEFFEDFEISYPYVLDKMVWYVPAARPGEQWKSLFLIFSKTLWLLILFSLIFNIITWRCFGQIITVHSNSLKNTAWCVLYSWYTLFLGSYNFPQNIVTRILVTVWVFIGFFLASAYQSQLLSILTTPIYEHQISNLQELVDSNLKIEFEEIFMSGFTEHGSEEENKVAKKVDFISVEEYLNMHKRDHDKLAFFEYPNRMRFYAHKYYTQSNGAPKLYEIEKTVFLVHIGFYTIKGYPYLPRFNNLILRMWQNGLLNKWILDTDRSMKQKNLDHGNIKLNINHFIGAIYIWIFGLITALFVFMCEISALKCCRTKIKKYRK